MSVTPYEARKQRMLSFREIANQGKKVKVDLSLLTKANRFSSKVKFIVWTHTQKSHKKCQEVYLKNQLLKIGLQYLKYNNPKNSCNAHHTDSSHFKVDPINKEVLQSGYR